MNNREIFSDETGEGLLNELNSLAPLSSEPVENLKDEGWEVFFTYRECNSSGVPEVEHLILAIQKVKEEIPQTLKDWKVCRARYDDIEDPVERERVHALMKKKTQERLDWEKSHF